MDTKQYLNQIYRIDDRIKSKVEQLNLLIPTSSMELSGDRVQSSPDLHSFENQVLNYMDKTENLKAEICSLQRLKDEVTAKINLIQNTDERLVLEFRHTLSKSWGDISEQLDLSERQVLRIYGKALKSMTKILEG